MIWLKLHDRMVNLSACLEARVAVGEGESAALYLVPQAPGEAPIQAAAGTPDEMAALLADLQGKVTKAGGVVLELPKPKPKASSVLGVFFGGKG